MSDIVVTGMGVVCATGHDRGHYLQSVQAGRCGIGPIAGLDLGWLPTQIGGQIAGLDLDAEVGQADGGLTRADALAIFAAREAIAQADLDLGSYRASRIGVSLGTCQGNIAAVVKAANGDGGSGRIGSSADALGGFLGAAGPRIIITNACAAGASAIAVAAEKLRQGELDVAITGGTDELAFFTLAGFSVLQSLDDQPCSPYARSAGLTVGEGAGILVLERREDAAARGAEPVAAILGYGLSADGHHPTAPDPTGRGGALAMRRALASAGRSIDDVDYVNGHGTGTAANDAMERVALKAVFGEAAGLPPMSSTKSMIGHLLGAAGAVEAITCILAIEEGFLPPTVNVPEDAALDFDCVPNRSRPGEVRIAMSNNYAFGGSNASLLVGTGSAVGGEDTAPRPVVITGIGAVGAAGHGIDEWRDRLAEGKSVVELLGPDLAGSKVAWGAPAPELDPRGIVPRATWRKMDVLGRLAVASSKLAWDDAGLDLATEEREEVGVLLATACGSLDVSVGFENDARQGRGVASAMDFPHTSTNSAAGHVCTTLGLHGPMLSISNGGAASLTALSFGVDLIRAGRAEVVLVCGVDELSGSVVRTADTLGVPLSDEAPSPFGRRSAGASLGSASVTVVLESLDHARRRGARPLAEVLATAQKSITDSDDGSIDLDTWTGALRAALERSGVAPEQVDYCAASASGVVDADTVEADALAEVLGARCWIAAPKAVTGDCLGVAGLVNVLSAVEALDRGTLTASSELVEPVDGGRLRHVLEPTVDPDIGCALATSVAIGSGVACTVLRGMA